MTSILATIISIITGVLGLLFGHYLSERKSRNDELARMRLEAYKDFITSASYLFAARRTGMIDDEVAELAALNDAKARICIYANEEVVSRLEKFWLQGGTMEKEQEILAFTHLCRAMRNSLGRDKLNLDINLSQVLFVIEPSSYSYKADNKSR